MKIPAIEELKARAQWVGYSNGKIPINPNTGGMASSTDPETWGTLTEAKYIRSVQGLKGVGFVFTPDDPYVGVDLDAAIDEYTGELYPWARAIVDELDSYTELSPSGLGVHVWIKGSLPRHGARRRHDEVKLEAYESGRYFTVTGKPLEGSPLHMREARPGELAAWFTQMFGEVDAPSSDVTVSAPHIEMRDYAPAEVVEWIDDALAHIPADDYDDWFRVGCALKGELGDAGYGYWQAWSATSAKYGGDEKTARKWAGIPDDNSVSMGTVVWLAEANGWTKPPSGPVLPAQFEHGWEQWIADQTALGDPQGVDDGLELKLYDLADLYEDRSPYEPHIVDPGILGEGDLMLLFGPPKSMKSMICLDMFRQFAMGEPWLGMSPARPLKTLYAQFELKADGMRRRAHLADLTPDEVERLRGNFITTGRFTPVLNAEFVASFAERALEQFGDGLDVLVLDPLANIFSGESENDNTEMAKFLRQIKYLRNRINPKVSIVLVHHANKRQREDRRSDPFGSIRGASSLRGAYDAGMYVDRLDETSGLIEAFFELRNGPGMAPKTLGFDRGRFHEVEAYQTLDGALTPDGAATRALDTTPEDLASEDPVAGAIAGLLIQDAEAGTVYQIGTFAELYAGHELLGSAGAIKRHLGRMATRGQLAFFREVNGHAMPATHHRSPGYLCVRGMTYRTEEGGPAWFVQPQAYKDASAGTIAPCGSWSDVG